jgi:hypothetical protein
MNNIYKYYTAYHYPEPSKKKTVTEKYNDAGILIERVTVEEF